MTFHGFLSRDSTATDATIYPAVREDAGGLVFEDGDGDDIDLLTATAIEVRTFDAKGGHLGQFVREVRIQGYVTDSRVAFACPKYAKGGGWRGDPVSMVVLNAGSKLLAAAKRHGRCLVGQVRYPWVVSVGWRSKTKTFSGIEEIRITVRDGTPGASTLTGVDLLLPRDLSSWRVANEIVRRVVAARLSDPLVDPHAQATLQRLAANGVDEHNDGDSFTMTQLPGWRLVGPMAAAPRGGNRPPPSQHDGDTENGGRVSSPALVSPPAPPPPPPPPPPRPAVPLVAAIRTAGPAAPASPPVVAPMAPLASPADDITKIGARSTEFLPHFAVVDSGGTSHPALEALDLRYETATWFPVPSAAEQVLDRFVVMLTAHVGVDSHTGPARQRGDVRLVRAFRGWSTMTVTAERLSGVCVQGQWLGGPVSYDHGSVVGWTFPLERLQAVAMVDTSHGPGVAVRSTDDLVGALVLTSAKRARPGGGFDGATLESLITTLDGARERVRRRSHRPSPEPAGTVRVAPVPSLPPPPVAPPVDDPSEIDGDILRASLGQLQPVCEYVTYLARGERSPLLGVGIDGFGRLDLDVEPPGGRHITLGQLWVTTTPAGRAPTAAIRGATDSLRFGPILEGGMELAVFDDHILGVHGTGGCLAGKVGEDGRMPALVFRLDLRLIEDVTIYAKPGLLGGSKETGFGLVRAGMPPFALRAESIVRIDGIPGWGSKSDGTKTSKGEPGRQIAIAAASLRLREGKPDRDLLERIVAGQWRSDEGNLVAELVPEDADEDEAAPPAPSRPASSIGAVPRPISAPRVVEHPVAAQAARPPVPVSRARPTPVEPTPLRTAAPAAPGPSVDPPPRPSRPHIRRGVVALVAALAVLAAGMVIGARSADREVAAGTDPLLGPVSTISAGGGIAPAVTASATGSSSGTAIPRTPSNNPTELAQQISLVERTILDSSQPDSRVAEAGRAQQLLLRRLDLDPRLAEQTVALIDPTVRSSVDQYLRSGRSITSLIDPQSSYPDEWRIVAPPPADELEGYFRAAETATGIRWEYLAAIASVETHMGRIKADSSAGAQGPMQFIPTTWEEYGAGGDIQSFRDASLAAARLLEANGGSDDIRDALYRYNPSDAYVEMVDRLAKRMIGNERQFLAIYQWQVLYKHVSGVALLPEGWPTVPARIVAPLAY